MKNYLTILPGFHFLRNYFNSIAYKLKNKQLLLGFNCHLSRANFGVYNSIGEECSIVNTTLGDYTYVSRNSRINNSKIGKYCSIGSNCLIGLGIHPTNDYLSTHPMFYSIHRQNGLSLVQHNSFEEFKEIIIGNDVWMGANVVILDGCNIGHGAIVAAGSIVNRDVLPFEVVGGIPIKQLKFRFEETKIQEILNSCWWDQSFDKIKSIKEKLNLK